MSTRKYTYLDDRIVKLASLMKILHYFAHTPHNFILLALNQRKRTLNLLRLNRFRHLHRHGQGTDSQPIHRCPLQHRPTTTTTSSVGRFVSCDLFYCHRCLRTYWTCWHCFGIGQIRRCTRTSCRRHHRCFRWPKPPNHARKIASCNYCWRCTKSFFIRWM